jgi:citrate lyase subunit beta/citryl-CoA lyase
MIRSLLFVPGDSPRKFASAMRGAADALVLDLEDAVAPSRKAEARSATAEMLRTGAGGDKRLFVRVNALDTEMTLEDLAVVMPLAPYAVVLPKCSGATDVARLAHYLDAFEAASLRPVGGTRILAIATETAASLFGLGSYAAVTPRLWGLMWGAEDLAASLGANANRADGRWLPPYEHARTMCLAGAAAAGVTAVDTVSTAIQDIGRLEQEAREARRDGFTAKAVIHPSHVEPVNAAFSPSEAEVAWARRVVAAFAADPAAGVVRIDGDMIDKPHLRAARRLLGDAP